MTNNSFILYSGSGRVMISAPHATEQTRNGKIKVAERQTGILAERLHNETGCAVIIKTANINDDANYDMESEYKNALTDYIKKEGMELLIDLHQMSPRRSVMIDLGTGNGKNLTDDGLLNILVKSFSEFGELQVDRPFAGASERTVSSFVRKRCGIQCLQLEINTRLLCPEYREYDLEGIYGALKEICLRGGARYEI